MKKHHRFALLGAVTGASLLSQSTYPDAGEIIRCTKKPTEYRLHHQCYPETKSIHYGGRYV